MNRKNNHGLKRPLFKPLARLGYSDYTTVDHSFTMEPSLAAGPRADLGLGLEGAAKTMGRIK